METMGLDYFEVAQQFPHCDSLVLHAPSECVYCDRHPDWQYERTSKGIPFTGHGIDPATLSRPLKTIERWGGNVAKTQTDIDEQTWSMRRLFNVMLAKKVGMPEGPVETWCDRCREPIEGLYYRNIIGFTTGGFYLHDPDEPRADWSNCFKDDEVLVCDRCMHDSACYQKLYGRG